MRHRFAFVSLILAGSTLTPPTHAQTKLHCSEVAATEAKCLDYDTQTKACEAAVDAELKLRVEAAKKSFDDCKKKNGMTYLAKCKKEMKASTTAVNTPRQVAAGPVEKDLAAQADSPCAKAEAIVKSAEICRGPKKALAALKANCIKDPG